MSFVLHGEQHIELKREMGGLMALSGVEEQSAMPKTVFVEDRCSGQRDVGY
jgi:hypothetical protein